MTESDQTSIDCALEILLSDINQAEKKATKLGLKTTTFILGMAKLELIEELDNRKSYHFPKMRQVSTLPN